MSRKLIDVLEPDPEGAERLSRSLGGRARMRIKEGWLGAGRTGRRLGPDVHAGQAWTPVLWDGEEDPSFHKASGLEDVPLGVELEFSFPDAEGRSIPEQVASELEAYGVEAEVVGRCRLKARVPASKVGLVRRTAMLYRGAAEVRP